MSTSHPTTHEKRKRFLKRSAQRIETLSERIERRLAYLRDDAAEPHEDDSADAPDDTDEDEREGDDE